MTGELALGQLKRRAAILDALTSLPQANIATHDEVLAYIARHRLHGQGIGFIDAHLLASSVLTRVPLWTADKRLREAASELGVAYT
ncbi:MAG: hypothetical protein WCI75_16110 [candidate division NC10 bacterium]